MLLLCWSLLALLSVMYLGYLIHSCRFLYSYYTTILFVWLRNILFYKTKTSESKWKYLAWRWGFGRRATQSASRSSQHASERSGSRSFPTRAAVGWRNSSRVVAWQQARWAAISFTVGGDFSQPDSSVCFLEASWEAALAAQMNTRWFPDT